MSRSILPQVVGGLHAWFESMRVEGGYGGPVSHWWRHSLRYAGPGLDWRYEGLINGYLNLFETTGNERWLAVAVRAGEDLVAGQVASGNYRASAFERNPELGGTPHEACASGALLRLARVCRAEGRDWVAFAETARDNLQWHLDALWRDERETFSDTVGMASYVPNKIASTVAAVLALVRLSDDETLVDGVVAPAAETILDLQVESGEYRGAIHQLSAPETGAGGDGKFFPLYVARCVPPLLAVGDATGEERFTEAAMAAGRFLKRVERADGSFPQVVYETGGRNTAPRWVAGVGDILRAYDALAADGHEFDTEAVVDWLLSGRLDAGAFRTATGFGRIVGRGDGATVPDVLPVVGWNDKAFRWLTTQVEAVEAGACEEARVTCSFDGSEGEFVESADGMEFVSSSGNSRTFEWDKESRWTQVR